MNKKSFYDKSCFKFKTKHKITPLFFENEGVFYKI